MCQHGLLWAMLMNYINVADGVYQRQHIPLR